MIHEASSGAAGCPLVAVEDIDGGSPADLGSLAEPIRIADGHFTPPDRPGHGIIFDRPTLAAHAIDP